MKSISNIIPVLICCSLIFAGNESEYVEEQKKLFEDHQNKVTKLKEEYVKNKQFIDTELERLLPLYNSLKRDYDTLVDSLDNIVKHRVDQYSEGLDDPEVAGHMYLMDRAKQSVAKKLDERKNFYKNKFTEIESKTDFYFDVLLAYESNDLDVNNLVLNLQAENFAIEEMTRYAHEYLNQLENGISVSNLNKSITSMIIADRFISNKEYGEAISECKSAIQLFPNLSIAYEKLGSAYYLNNNFEEALKNWNTALAMNPDNSYLSEFLSALK